MIKVIVRDPTFIYPFNEPARDLLFLSKPLWLIHRDILNPYCREEREYELNQPIEPTNEATVVYRDNLYFNEDLFKAFLKVAQTRDKPSQIAFHSDDASITHHAIHLQSNIRKQGDVYVGELYFYPQGYRPEFESQVEPVIVDTLPGEIGYYHVPTYMAYEKGDLIFKVPRRPFLSIENWVHVFTANTAFGVFSIASRVLHDLDQPLLQGSLQLSAKIFLRSLLERKQFLESSPLVVVGKNCQIDPRAIVRGPTIIGDNVAIEPGAVINNCVIGNNVSIQQGCQLYASVVGSGTFLPFRASLFMTTMMENSMVAQNTCLQMCVLGRNTFVGAGNTFTDFNLLAKPIKTTHKGKLVDVHLPVLGGCVGHNCRIGSGHIVFPGRIIESDVVLFAKDTKHVIDRNVLFSASDHHNYPNEKHVPLYQPQEE